MAKLKQLNQKNLIIVLVVLAGAFIILKVFEAYPIIFLLILGIVLYQALSGEYTNIIPFITNLSSTNNMKDDIHNEDFGVVRSHWLRNTGGIILVGVFLLWLSFRSVVIVGAGETGVVSLFGKVRDGELSSGFHVVNPFVKVQKMSIRTEQYTMSIAANEGQVAGDDSIRSLTKEGLDVDIDFTALYRLDEQMASDIYREVGLDYVNKLIRPEIRGVIRDVVSQYEAKELYSEKRQEASARMESMLKETLEPRGLVMEEAVIRNVQLPASLAQAIQEKLASEQEAQRYDFVLQKERKEAERKIIEAEGQRDAQTIINESLSPEYLNYLYIKELKERAGTIYVPIGTESGMPIFKGVE